MAKKAVVPGAVFGRLTVTKIEGVMGEATCACGKPWVGRYYHLFSGAIVSCGCFRKQNAGLSNFTHGHTSGGCSKLYHAWQNMRSRCYRNSPINHLYKKKGIKVCRRWKNSFENFAADVGEPPTKDHTIERIDNDGHYTPENVCWATRKVQGGNTCKVIKVTAFGQTKTLRQWSEIYPISARTLWCRLDKRWPPEKALTTPVKFIKRWHST